MSKRAFVVRANFPRQQADLVETVEAGNWAAAVGMAARRMKQRMKGNRIKAASFTVEQLAVVPLAVVPAEQQMLPEVAPAAAEPQAAAEGQSDEPHNNS